MNYYPLPLLPYLGGSARSSAHCTFVLRISMAGRMVFFSSSMAVLPLPAGSGDNKQAGSDGELFP